MRAQKNISIITALLIAGTTIMASSSGAFAAGINQSGKPAGPTIGKASRCFTMCTNGPVRVPCKAGQAGRFIKCYAVKCSRICVPRI